MTESAGTREPADIALLIPDLRGGGAERVAINLAKEFATLGASVEFVLMRREGEFLYEVDDRMRIVDLGAGRIRGALVPLVSYLRTARPRALIAFMWPLTLVAVVARVLGRAPTRLLVTEHTTLSASAELTSKVSPWIVFRSIGWLYPLADRIVTVSRGAADDMASHARLDRRAVSVVYNPITGAAGKARTGGASPDVERWSSAPFRAIAIGTMKEQKRFDRLLEAFCLLRARVPAQLLILGDGPLRASLVRRAAELGVTSAVTMPGFVPDPAPYLRRAHLFVLSSAWEGFGNVIVEALSEGVPVVSTDCPSGPREILADGRFGRLVPVDDAPALAAAMDAALSEVPDREALRARAAEFSVARAAEQYLRLMFPDDLRWATGD
jgi:glycosyltransferase involved in cell wall biosynthesis